MSEAEKAAAGLTKAQREALRQLCEFGEVRPSWAVFILIWKGLADYRRRYWLFGEEIVIPTRAGKLVRAILERNQP